MRFSYYDRLSPARKKIYRQSDEIAALGLPPGLDLGEAVLQLELGLRADNRAAVQRECQGLLDALVAGYHVPRIRVRVLAERPADDYGELHGLYEPEEGRALSRLSVWMRTAQRRQVVAFKTFLRTLIHELCHHLDYELFALEETFHTEGFYKRESDLVSALLGQRQAASERLGRP
jgi:hypothetical protein